MATATTWHQQVRENGGLIISIDGMQPDTGNATVYLVRDVLTGRVLAAEHVRVSDTATIKRRLAPVVAVDLPVLGAVRAAQESLCQASAALWPEIPQQLCQLHDLRAASRPVAAGDRAIRTAIRKAIQPPVRAVRDQLERQAAAVETDPAEAEQLAVLGADALAIQTALNLDGQQPCKYASVATAAALTEVAASLEELEKGGAHDVDARQSSVRG